MSSTPATPLAMSTSSDPRTSLPISLPHRATRVSVTARQSAEIPRKNSLTAGITSSPAYAPPTPSLTSPRRHTSSVQPRAAFFTPRRPARPTQGANLRVGEDEAPALSSPASMTSMSSQQQRLGTRRSTLSTSIDRPDTPGSEMTTGHLARIDDEVAFPVKASREQLLDVPTPAQSDFARRIRSSFTSVNGGKGGEKTLPVYAVDEKGQRVRNYQLHEGGNRFFAQGRFITSRDSPLPFLASCFIAVLLPILFFAFTGSWMWNELSGGRGAAVVVAYLVGIMWSSMLRTAWRDPGIVPRNMHEPDVEYIACPHGAPEDIGGSRAEQPVPRQIRYRDEMVTCKWCETCGTYRPPRTSHCRLCNNCVERTDHHCTFLNTCIGRRNYSTFLAFVISAVLAIILVFALSIARAASARPVLSSYSAIGSLTVAILCVAVGVPIGGLLSYHLRLIWLGTTTIEMIRPRGAGSEGRSMFAHDSIWHNVVGALCRPMTASSGIRARKWATTDSHQWYALVSTFSVE